MKRSMITAVETFARKGCKPVLLATVLLALFVTPLMGKNPPRIAPPGSVAYGKSLTEWLSIYWRWSYGTGADITQSKVGIVQLMPIPAGDWTGSGTLEDPWVAVGRLEITIPAGTPFVLPQFSWVGERYQGYPSVPDDPTMADECVLNYLRPTLTIDGITVMSEANMAAFYVPPTFFDPIVVYPEPTWYGAVAGVFFQGVGLVCQPLPVGVHEIHLFEPYLLPAGCYPLYPDGLGLVYDNTWIVTVVPYPVD